MFILPVQPEGARASPSSTLMGPGDCFRTIVSLKKAKEGTSRQAKVELCAAKSNGSKQDSQRKSGIPGKRIEDTAATRIQAAFRAYLARRTLYRLRCAVRFQSLTHGLPAIQQVSTALDYLHSWSRIQTQIRARRINMVAEARMRQKRLENQLKFEAKLRKLELEWCGGPGTKEDILAKIQQREAAAAKRERALAYAFSHQNVRVGAGWNIGLLPGPGKSDLSRIQPRRRQSSSANQQSHVIPKGQNSFNCTIETRQLRGNHHSHAIPDWPRDINL